MSGEEHDITEETAILARLAQAHKLWRDQRPAQPERPTEDPATMAARLLKNIKNQGPLDVQAVLEAPSDPLGTAIWSQLCVVGWRLYAKGGSALLTSVYLTIERDHHPGFVNVLLRAWRKLGFLGDPRGVWGPTTLL